MFQPYAWVRRFGQALDLQSLSLETPCFEGLIGLSLKGNREEPGRIHVTVASGSQHADDLHKSPPANF